MVHRIKRAVEALLCLSLCFAMCSCQINVNYNTSATEKTTENNSTVSSAVSNTPSQIYADQNNWAYCGDGENKTADVFVLCPTVFSGDEENFNMSLDDNDTKQKFYDTLTTGLGIYNGDCKVYAPYYRQVGMVVYGLNDSLSKGFFDTAYSSVRDAFLYYMQNYNNGRPIVLAGFSQGADMTLRLMKEFFTKEEYSKQLVAAYAVGWHFTKEEAQQYPQLKMAQGETDTGVIISYNSEEDYVTTSLLVPDTTLSINPLNWRTDSTPADKSLNLGACFCDNSGAVVEEIPEFTGAYIDEERGTLKVTDVDDTLYINGFSTFGSGVYHVYDCEFFYRNLQKNVLDRISAFINKS